MKSATRRLLIQGSLIALLLVLPLGVLWAQEVPSVLAPSDDLQQWNEQILGAGQIPPDGAREDYRIGSEDLVEISVFEVPELSRTVRVSASGEVSLPLLGALRVVGLTPRELEGDLTDRLRGAYLHDPQVSVFLKEYKSSPVSVVGAVKVPGLYRIQTSKMLIELLAMAQGFSDGPLHQPGRTIIVTRRPRTQWKVSGNGEMGTDPVSGSGGAEATRAESIEIPIKQLMQSGDAQWNVPIYPGDVVKVVPAGTFYVAGDVTRPGGFPLQDFDDVSVIQALAMAGGPLKSSDLKNSVIIRRDAEGNRVEETIDLRDARKGEDLEIALGENDILFVPGSITKTVALRAIETSIQLATGMLIWHR